MSAPEAALKAAILAALDGAMTVTTRFGSPPRFGRQHAGRAAYPFFRWGRAESRERGTGEARLIEHRLSLELHLRDDDAAERLGEVRAVLAGAAMTLAGGWRLIHFAPVLAEAFDTREPRIRRAVLRLRAVMAPETEGETP